MGKLVFNRRKPQYANSDNQNYRVRVGKEEYNKIVEIADESGETLKFVIDKVINYAYENTVFESGDK